MRKSGRAWLMMTVLGFQVFAQGTAQCTAQSTAQSTADTAPMITIKSVIISIDLLDFTFVARRGIEQVVFSVDSTSVFPEGLKLADLNKGDSVHIQCAVIDTALFKVIKFLDIVPQVKSTDLYKPVKKSTSNYITRSMETESSDLQVSSEDLTPANSTTGGQ